jgi:DNA-binding NarL/FixJ family response regulator
MVGSMADEQERSIYLGYGSAPPSLALARINLEPKVYHALYGTIEDPELDTREHILARITPREWVFVEYVCQHPELTDEEIREALGLQERTVLAYFAHLGRNFNVRTSAQLRHWAFKKQLIRSADDPARDDLAPDDAPPVDPPTPGFDPWVRWN